MERAFQDHLGRTVELAQSPRRIVSLCPSLTETLFALGLQDRIVGRTSFCVHPAQRVDAVPTVGGIRNVDLAAVAALRPDLVIAAKEENRREDVEALAAFVPVFVMDVASYQEALRAIRDLGAITGRERPAAEMAVEISRRFERLPRGLVRRVAYLIWRDPYTTVGRETYVHSLLARCGLKNLAAGLPGRYPQVTLEHLRTLAPELVLLSSEPFPFDQSHVDELTPRLPRSKLVLVDGEMFSWYGGRMILAADYLADLLAREL